MTIHVDEATTYDLVSQDEATAVVEATLAAYGRGEALNAPRVWLAQPGGGLNVLAGAIPANKVTGYKAFANFGQGREWRLFLFDTASGRLTGVLEANGISDLRTVASSLVSIRWMAKRNARSVGIVGTGHQARIHGRALLQGGWCDRLLVYSRSSESLNAYRRWLESALDVTHVPLQLASSVEELAGQADVVITATKSPSPVLKGSWLRPGTHVVAMGSHARDRREIDEETLGRATEVAVDCLTTAAMQYGELIEAVESGHLRWESVRPISDFINSESARASSGAQDISVYKSGGIGVLDVAVGQIVLENAQKNRRGQPLSI